MKDTEQVLKALANKRRLQIILLLRGNREATVENIAAHIKLSFKATSRHLGILMRADILERDQRSRYAYYRLASYAPDEAAAIVGML